MFRKLGILVIVALITSVTFRVPAVFGNESAKSADAARIETKVRSLEVGTRVEVKLSDQTKYKGRIAAIGKNTFTITDDKTGNSTELGYNEVDDLKKAGGGLSTKSWIIIGAAAAGAVVTWSIVKPALCDGGAQTRGPC